MQESNSSSNNDGTTSNNSKNEATTTTTTPSTLQRLPPTDMLYLTYHGNFQTVCESQILAVVVSDNNSVTQKTEQAGDDGVANSNAVSIVLDQTVLHAQGGGQPTDIGTLTKIGSSTDDEDASIMFQVSKVSIDRSSGVAVHTGTPTTTTTTTKSNTTTKGDTETPSSSSLLSFFQVGDRVQVRVDVETRRILSECHTAGHVVDSALNRCGFGWKPSKAYHYLEGPYVEYQGHLSADDDRDTVLAQLQTAFGQLVDENLVTDIAIMSRDEAQVRCHQYDMDVFADPHTNHIRVVTVAGYSCPCGGTHVRSTGELAEREWHITGLKVKKGGIVRVKYGKKN
jgi:Ser-tRNA(Ala) deacylase AlaX